MTDSSSGNKSFLGVEVEWKINLSNLVSLLVSILTALYVGYNYLRGPQLEMAPPSWLYIWAEDYGSVGVVVSVGSEMTYLNTAAPGYDAAISFEFAEIMFNNKKYRFVGRQQVLFDNPRTDPDCPTQNLGLGEAAELPDGSRMFGCQSKEPRLRIRNPAKIERIVLGGRGASHETEFAPAFVECEANELDCKEGGFRFLPWQEFMSNLKEGDHLSFRLGVRLIDGTDVAKNCVVSVMKPDLVYLTDRSWHSFQHCESNTANHRSDCYRPGCQRYHR
jgi:hypothetical protein